MVESFKIMEGNMKKLSVFILIFALCTALLSGCMITFPSFTSFHYDDADKYTPGGASITDTVSRIEVEWVSGEVNVATHSDKDVTFFEESSTLLKDSTSLYYWLEGTTLHIKFCRSGIRSLNNLKKDLTLLIPEELSLREIEVESVSGGISISGIDADEIKAEAVSGGISLDSCASGEVNVETVSGNAEISSVEGYSFDIETVSGAVSFSSGSAPRELDIETVSGQIVLYLPEDSDFTMDFDTVSGAFSSELEYKNDGKRYIFGMGMGDYSIDTTSGNVEIKTF